MKTLVREIPLTNGLTVRFYDATRRYFGDYHQVRVTISFEVPLCADLFEDAATHESAVKLLGPQVNYVKEIEHQGVPTLATAETLEKVIQHFIDNSLAYFETEAFPKKFVHAELNKVRGKAKAYVPLRANG